MNTYRMGKNKSGKGESKKRKDRGSTNSSKSATISPHTKKTRTHGHGGHVSTESESDSESCDSESESETDRDSIRSLVKKLAKGQSDQRKILDGISKKQDNISTAVEDLGRTVIMDRLDVSIAEQNKSIEFVHSEIRSLKDDNSQSRGI